MKYNENNQPLQCMMTNSTCYKGTRKMEVKGILIHCTGANNPTLKRYVQPSESDPNYQKLIKMIGKNQYNNDLNHIYREMGMNAWIGKLEDGTVTTLQTMPWDYRPWGCGSGSNGSCNNGWIQFEMCEDGLTDKKYFDAVYNEMIELVAYLCKKYNLNPKGTTKCGNINNVPVILCHYDSYKYGLGSNHYDVYNWFNNFNKEMEDVIEDVYALLNPKPQEIYRIRKTWNDAGSQKGAYTNLDNAIAACDKLGETYKVFNSKGEIVYQPTPKFKPYVIKVTALLLYIRKGPGASYKTNGVVKFGDAYTIVEEQNGFGKLKSGAGWISLKYTRKI